MTQVLNFVKNMNFRLMGGEHSSHNAGAIDGAMLRNNGGAERFDNGAFNCPARGLWWRIGNHHRPHDLSAFRIVAIWILSLKPMQLRSLPHSGIA